MTKMLVIDDDPMIRMITSQYFESLDHQVTTANNGKEFIPRPRLCENACKEISCKIINIILEKPKLNAMGTPIMIMQTKIITIKSIIFYHLLAISLH